MEKWDELEQALREACPGLETRRGEPMARHTSVRVGGPAALMALPKTLGEASAVLKTAFEAGIEPFFLGNGSNLLVADTGYDGLVIKLAGELEEIRCVPPEKPGANARLEAGAAALLSRLSKAALEHGLTGLEFAQGIPGSVGGAVAMNAGAYGGEIAQVLRSARVLQPDGEIVDMENADLAFGYRTSALQAPGRICLGARFVLQRGDREEISGRMADLAARRREKQPLQFPSAGSFFKRPEGYFAGRLIEEAGLKGAHVGGAQVSSLHAGFLINTGGATAGDFLALMERVQRAVYEREGVRLEPEVRILGQDGAEEVGRE